MKIFARNDRKSGICIQKGHENENFDEFFGLFFGLTGRLRNLYPTRPVSGAGQPDRFPFLECSSISDAAKHCFPAKRYIIK